MNMMCECGERAVYQDEGGPALCGACLSGGSEPHPTGVTNTNTNTNVLTTNTNELTTKTNTKESVSDGEMDHSAPDQRYAKDVPEMRLLLEDFAKGLISPVEVELGPLPSDATPLMHDIANDMRLRMGLQLEVGDDRPIIYAYSEAVTAKLARYKMEAFRAIRRLLEAGVIQDAGQLRNGARLYAAPVPSYKTRKVPLESTSVEPLLK